MLDCRREDGIVFVLQGADMRGSLSLQLRILQRAMRMLKKGGRIVYSTCSINPVENEAVVAAALRSIPGASATVSDYLKEAHGG